MRTICNKFKQKNKRSLIFLTLSLAATLVMISCSKLWKDVHGQSDPTTPTPEQEISVLGDLQAPSNSNWKTVKDVEITISGSTDGIVNAISTRRIVYQKAFLSSSQIYVMKLMVPTYETLIQLKKDSRSEIISLSSDKVTYSFN